MTETIIKLGVFDEHTRKHRFTIVLKKIILDKPYYVRCDERGDAVDLRKGQSYADLDLSTDKLKQTKGFYDISISKSKSFDDECYVKLPTKFDYNLATVLQIAQKTISSNIVFVSIHDGYGMTHWDYPPFVRGNRIHDTSRWYTSSCSAYTFITEDLLGEDIPTPDRVFKQIKVRKDKERRKQSRIKLFETFILPGLDIEGLRYDTYDQAFYMGPNGIQNLIKKYIKEVVIPKLKEIGVQTNIDDFKAGSFMYCQYKLPLKKVKLDNIDDIEQQACEGE